MKIIRHTARDMRQALRGVREQLGEDAVILSSRRTGDGVEITAAIDFDASTLEAGGFANTPAEPPPIIDAPIVSVSKPRAAPAVAALAAPATNARSSVANNPTVLALTTKRAPKADKSAAVAMQQPAPQVAVNAYQQPSAPLADYTPAAAYAASYDELALVGEPLAFNPAYDGDVGFISEAAREAVAEHVAAPRAPVLAPAALQAREAIQAYGATDADDAIDASAAMQPREDVHASAAIKPFAVPDSPVAARSAASARGSARAPAPAPTAAVASRSAAPAPTAASRLAAPTPAAASRTAAPTLPAASRIAAPTLAPAPLSQIRIDTTALFADEPVELELVDDYHDPVEEIREATLTPLASPEVKAAFAELKAPAASAPAATEAMGNELKTLRRMLETQLAHLAWNDLTRRAPVHTEILRELTEIGIAQDLAEHLVRQLPEDVELTFARRFTIAGLSQYLKVTGDRWLDDGGRVAFVGGTGVGKTTTLAKIAVRWVLRHGPRDIALVAGDSVRIGAQDQLQSLAQLLGVPVYTPEKFESLPTLLSQLNERLILIDTPGSSVRDPQLASRLAVLANSASKLQTALVLAASTQAGAIEEAVKHFAPANPSCCVLTKLDEAASLGGVLSVLIRARLPVSYMSEGQRVPEDLRPARTLELVSAAVRLAKASGAAADEDLLRRRFGKTAHGIS